MISVLYTLLASPVVGEVLQANLCCYGILSCVEVTGGVIHRTEHCRGPSTPTFSHEYCACGSRMFTTIGNHRIPWDHHDVSIVMPPQIPPRLEFSGYQCSGDGTESLRT